MRFVTLMTRLTWESESVWVLSHSRFVYLLSHFPLLSFYLYVSLAHISFRLIDVLTMILLPFTRNSSLSLILYFFPGILSLTAFVCVWEKMISEHHNYDNIINGYGTDIIHLIFGED